MQEPFELPVTYKGQELLFPAHLQQFGYIHRIVVDVSGTEVAFEPDEERNYRGIVDPEKPTRDIHPDLLKAIAETIESIVK